MTTCVFICVHKHQPFVERCVWPCSAHTCLLQGLLSNFFLPRFSSFCILLVNSFGLKRLTFPFWNVLDFNPMKLVLVSSFHAWCWTAFCKSRNVANSWILHRNLPSYVFLINAVVSDHLCNIVVLFFQQEKMEPCTGEVVRYRFTLGKPQFPPTSVILHEELYPLNVLEKLDLMAVLSEYGKTFNSSQCIAEGTQVLGSQELLNWLVKKSNMPLIMYQRHI